ncbi:hypothetical protein A3K29_02525 [Candidatus Collierbacteria bacterium RIFOXYB2_FULL_46_14]|uniref:Uncharacterized protein n=1 Tax=Candidatus Collierbacteria bacterium GW2011_GWA2_46_26 TaxID=1618381 RepID=A0A0G1RVD0_9BACT|nr:MAG: hypothetical protein UW29_C0004G0010 [Candidatus Collierbacteria bacterium GW2011_GWC2_44_13]KKU33938.1 MAG: hypothetical protein UX47_C0001G0221 [Candidatus Collierbacteria bacterium GW2011_GWA2_46_26]OGD72995.1 MAG: hypothetical protein A3K29_02525 [Candidatus Collierbacteria bacterium RIFOXYB2_FULL_46_14]OGD76037.1 MAG: hypothetical protein A3K43_02525 [Candidatus Collierbacteria bacterium RIFOXYA2_FULL_46_20]OGD77373.1 MAG: hypothetical protein A3K39_02525 [Candidatus Collierbacteri
MRKLIWIILILIAFVWLAIAFFWTGVNTENKSYDFPEATPTVSEEVQSQISPVPPATSSSEATPSSPVKLLSPTVKVNLNY